MSLRPRNPSTHGLPIAPLGYSAPSGIPLQSAASGHAVYIPPKEIPLPRDSNTGAASSTIIPGHYVYMHTPFWASEMPGGPSVGPAPSGYPYATIRSRDDLFAEVEDYRPRAVRERVSRRKNKTKSNKRSPSPTPSGSSCSTCSSSYSASTDASRDDKKGKTRRPARAKRGRKVPTRDRRSRSSSRERSKEKKGIRQDHALGNRRPTLNFTNHPNLPHGLPLSAPPTPHLEPSEQPFYSPQPVAVDRHGRPAGQSLDAGVRFAPPTTKQNQQVKFSHGPGQLPTRPGQLPQRRASAPTEQVPPTPRPRALETPQWSECGDDFDLAYTQRQEQRPARAATVSIPAGASSSFLPAASTRPVMHRGHSHSVSTNSRAATPAHRMSDLPPLVLPRTAEAYPSPPVEVTGKKAPKATSPPTLARHLNDAANPQQVKEAPIVTLLFANQPSVDLTSSQIAFDSPNAFTALLDSSKHKLKPGHMLRVPIQGRSSALTGLIAVYMQGTSILPLSEQKAALLYKQSNSSSDVDAYELLYQEAVFYGLERLQRLVLEHKQRMYSLPSNASPSTATSSKISTTQRPRTNAPAPPPSTPATQTPAATDPIVVPEGGSPFFPHDTSSVAITSTKSLKGKQEARQREVEHLTPAEKEAFQDLERSHAHVRSWLKRQSPWSPVLYVEDAPFSPIEHGYISAVCHASTSSSDTFRLEISYLDIGTGLMEAVTLSEGLFKGDRTSRLYEDFKALEEACQEDGPLEAVMDAEEGKGVAVWVRLEQTPSPSSSSPRISIVDILIVGTWRRGKDRFKSHSAGHERRGADQTEKWTWRWDEGAPAIDEHRWPAASRKEVAVLFRPARPTENVYWLMDMETVSE